MRNLKIAAVCMNSEAGEIEKIRKHKMAYFIPNRRPELDAELRAKSR